MFLSGTIESYQPLTSRNFKLLNQQCYELPDYWRGSPEFVTANTDIGRMKKQYLNPESLPDWSNMFSQVVTAEQSGIRFIRLSGQVGVNREKQLVGSGGLREQTAQALLNLQSALSSAGAGFEDVVKLVVYVVRYQSDQAAIIAEELQKVFPAERRPALTLLGVSALANDAFLIEIDAEALTTQPSSGTS